MATYFPLHGAARELPTPLTLTALQISVAGFIKFIDLPSGDILVVNEAAPDLCDLNKAASALAHQPIHGDAVLCTPEEIA